MGFQKLSIFTGNPETNMNYMLRPKVTGCWKKLYSIKAYIKAWSSLVMPNTLKNIQTEWEWNTSTKQWNIRQDYLK